MKEITYKLDTPKNISDTDKKIFLELLIQQGKVTNPTLEKINRCTFLCLCKVDNKIISIGAIKPKTNSDFNSDKADLDKFRNDFSSELGYCFTLPDHTGKGFSSSIVKLLLDKFSDTNLMASTELRVDNSMTRILEKNNFKQFGKPWKSTIHKGTLGLFLKFVK
ncbi:MAG: hypothetical protein KF825_09995 [Ferruginibacter sp.]|nr:hypothetical protein [Bacteroidota bacterium]MBX2934568.1 hypothetical protein [Ferruginibacter sp.]